MGSIIPLAVKWNAATITWSTLFREVLADTATETDAIATTIPSDTREEDYAWLDRIPQMREWIGERKVNNVSIRMQTLINKLYEATIGVRRVDIEDDKIGAYRPLFEELARSAKQLKDRLVFQAVQTGTSATVYDNQHFFDSSHPVNMDDPSIVGPNGSPLQSNNLVNMPLTAENLSAAITTMQSWFGADGLPLRIGPDTLLVPPQQRFTAKRLLNAELIGSDIALALGQHGAATQSNVLKGALEPVVADYLATDPNTCYLLCTKRAIKPFIWQLREAAEFVPQTRPDDENVFKRDEFLYGVRERGVAGWGPWFLALRMTANPA